MIMWVLLSVDGLVWEKVFELEHLYLPPRTEDLLANPFLEKSAGVTVGVSVGLLVHL